MSRDKFDKTKLKAARRASSEGNISSSGLLNPQGHAKREKHFEFFIVTVLFLFGIYHSFLYFGHRAVPNPDFTAFVNLGHELLSFQYPSSFKRVPVLGILQAGLSYFVGGQHPDLTAGWLLNAILHPFNIVLLWLVGKRIIGRSAKWVAIVAIINPWVLQLLSEPIAETTLLFFVLLTFYFMFRRSGWCYLFASITMMVRYEGAALILAAFVMDMIEAENKRQRIKAFIYSAIAIIPLALWMLGTVLSWRGAGTTHYLKELGAGGAFKATLIKYLELIWRVSFYPLFIAKPSASKESVAILLNLSKILAAVSFVFGAVYGLCKRNWKILVLLIFLVPYFMIHVAHSFVLARFCVIVHWIVILICLYGLQSAWQLINKNSRIPKVIIIMLQAVLLILISVWLIMLILFLPKAAPLSETSASLPYVAIAVVIAIFGGARWIHKTKHLWRDIVVSLLMCLIIVSNQLMVVQVVGNGQRHLEFRYLANWYVANAQPGEKMVSALPNILSIFAPKDKESFVHLSSIKAQAPEDFVRQCYESDITYVTWDSVGGFNVGGRYYKLWGFKNIAMLRNPRDIGPYEFIGQVSVNKRQFINIFRLKTLNLSGVK